MNTAFTEIVSIILTTRCSAVDQLISTTQIFSFYQRIARPSVTVHLSVTILILIFLEYDCETPKIFMISSGELRNHDNQHEDNYQVSEQDTTLCFLILEKNHERNQH